MKPNVPSQQQQPNQRDRYIDQNVDNIVSRLANLAGVSPAEVRETPRQYSHMLVFCDPGKNDLVYCRSFKEHRANPEESVPEKTFIYSQEHRERELGTKKDRRRRIDEMKERQIDQIFNLLGEGSSMAFGEDFDRWVEIKFQFFDLLYHHFNQPVDFENRYLRALNKTQADLNYIKAIKQQLPNKIFIVGDWSKVERNMRFQKSTATIALLELLDRAGIIWFHIDEYHTSAMCSQNPSHRLVPSPKLRLSSRPHQLARGRMGGVWGEKWCNVCQIFIHRDKNAVKNMYEISICLIEHHTIPEAFTRPGTAYNPLKTGVYTFEFKLPPNSNGFYLACDHCLKAVHNCHCDQITVVRQLMFDLVLQMDGTELLTVARVFADTAGRLLKQVFGSTVRPDHLAGRGNNVLEFIEHIKEANQLKYTAIYNRNDDNRTPIHNRPKIRVTGFTPPKNRSLPAVIEEYGFVRKIRQS
jgi:hypothetical protein